MVERPGMRAGALAIWCVVLQLFAACGDAAKPSTTEASLSASGAAGSSQTSDSGRVEGTGEQCDSYTPAAGERCGSWFCGVTQKQLQRAVDPAAVCSGSVALICEGSAVSVVAECARMLKLATPLASNELLRPRVRECAMQGGQLQGTRSECLDCIFDGFACTADNCLLQCLAGNSPECDSCRLAANCDQQSFRCAGLPWPRS